MSKMSETIVYNDFNVVLSLDTDKIFISLNNQITFNKYEGYVYANKELKVLANNISLDKYFKMIKSAFEKKEGFGLVLKIMDEYVKLDFDIELEYLSVKFDFILRIKNIDGGSTDVISMFNSLKDRIEKLEEENKVLKEKISFFENEEFLDEYEEYDDKKYKKLNKKIEEIYEMFNEVYLNFDNVEQTTKSIGSILEKNNNDIICIGYDISLMKHIFIEKNIFDFKNAGLNNFFNDLFIYFKYSNKFDGILFIDELIKQYLLFYNIKIPISQFTLYLISNFQNIFKMGDCTLFIIEHKKFKLNDIYTKMYKYAYNINAHTYTNLGLKIISGVPISEDDKNKVKNIIKNYLDENKIEYSE